ncbi:MAG TPA: tetratricopeptide repeat protein [Trichormus sp.]|jgi:superkiller protein 3
MTAKVSQAVFELVAQGKWDEAYAMLAQMAAQSPNDPRIEFELGVLCYNMGNYEESERHFKTSLSIHYDSPESHYHLGLTLLKQNRAAEAMPEFRDVCERKPGFAVGHLHWGMALAGMGSLRGALGQFNQALKFNPNFAAAYYQAGLISFELGQYSEALQFFQRACSIEPTMAEGYNAMGVALSELGNLADALACYERAWLLDNTLGVVKRNLAAVLMRMGQLDDAVKHYQEAVTLPPRYMSAKDRAQTYNDWAVNLFQQNRLDEAAEKLYHSVDTDPTFVQARMNLGLVHTAMQEYELAANEFDKALEAQPDVKQIAIYAAVSYLFLGRYEDALQKLSLLHSQGIRSPELDLWTGYAHIAVGQPEEAERFFESASMETSVGYLALDGWGCCLAIRGFHDQAMQKFQQSASMQPDYALAHLHLARTLEDLGRQHESEVEYREAVIRDPSCLQPEKEATESLLNASNFEAAMAKAAKLLNIVPGDIDAKLALGRALKAQNRIQEAEEMVLRVLETDPSHGPARVLLGQIFVAEGRFVEADEMFRSASELFDGDAPLFFYWGRTLSLLGLHEMALEKYEKAAEIDPYDADTYDAWGAALKTLGRYQDAAEVYRRAAEYI